MNRSILIVICDFLLVSLLAFSTVDINKVADEGAPRMAKFEIATNNQSQVDSGKDLAAVMRLALNEERKGRDQLLGELAAARAAAGDREKQTMALQEELQARDAQAQQLQEQQTNLQQQFAAAQANLQSMTQQLQASSSEALMSQQKLEQMEAEARKAAEQSSTLQQQLAQLTATNQATMAEKQQLATKLQVAEVERRNAVEQVGRMTEEVKVERAEKAKLAENVQALASNSKQLAAQIQENTPLAPNTIFSDFVANRVQAHFTATRSGMFGSNKHRDAATVLVTDGTNTFALCHVQDTPLTLEDPGAEWDVLTASLSHQASAIYAHSLQFAVQDPRLVWLPLSPGDARELGCKTYRISATPYKFQDAVLVGTRGDYYGECKFQIDLSTPDYVKLDRSLLKGLFGQFNPSRGDLVISKTGELLGLMVNGTYCLMLHNFEPGGTLQLGNDVRAQNTGAVLSGLYMQLAQLPYRLQ